MWTFFVGVGDASILASISSWQTPAPFKQCLFTLIEFSVVCRNTWNQHFEILYEEMMTVSRSYLWLCWFAAQEQLCCERSDKKSWSERCNCTRIKLVWSFRPLKGTTCFQSVSLVDIDKTPLHCKSGCAGLELHYKACRIHFFGIFLFKLILCSSYWKLL